MELTVNVKIHFFLLCFIDLDLKTINSRKRSVVAFESSYVIAAVGKRKELSCSDQASNPPRMVSWYRITNDDIRKCPNRTYFFSNSEVFCDRLTNNRILQPGFTQRFSVPALQTDNQNNLIITRIELSDFGIYACIEHNSNKTLVRINLTAEEDSSSTSKNSSLPGTRSPLETTSQDTEISFLSTSSSIQSVGNSHLSPVVNTVVGVSVLGAAIVCVIVTIAIVVFLKIRRSKEGRIEVRSSQDVVSGQIPNNMIELSAPVYEEIKENGGTCESVVTAEATIYWKVVDDKTVLDKDQIDEPSVAALMYAEIDQLADVRVTRSADNNQSIILSPVYEFLKASDGDESDVRSAAAAGEMRSDLMTSSDVAVQDQSNHVASAIPIYADVNSAKNETSKEGAVFNSKDMTAFNPIYGEITTNDNITEATDICSKADDVKKTTNVGIDGTVYLELNKGNGSGVDPSMQQPKQQLFQKSVYAMIDHNGKPPTPPPALPRRSYYASPR